MNFIPDDDDDIWGSDEDSSNLGSFEKSNEFAAIQKDGFRHGKQKTDESEMQAGFDIGFEKGTLIGKLCGSFYAQCIFLSDSFNDSGNNNKSSHHVLFQQGLKRILYDDVDVTSEGEGTYIAMMLNIKKLIKEQEKHLNDSIPILIAMCDQLESDLMSVVQKQDTVQVV